MVIAIIGLLASIVLVSLNSARTKARDARRKAELQALAKGLALYVQDNNGKIPLSNQCGSGRSGQVHGVCVNNTDSPSDWYIGDYMVSHKYISASPRDPKTNLTCKYFYYTDSSAGYAQFSATLENPSAQDLATMTTGPMSGECNQGNYRIVVSP